MSKKIYFLIAAAIATAVLGGLLASGTVLAKNPELIGRNRKPRGMLGQVVSIGAEQFTILKRDGVELEILVDDETKFRDLEGSELSFDDLVEDRWVVVGVPRRAEEPIIARMVVILPEDFDPENMINAGGVIDGIDVNENQITLKSRLGEELVFGVDGETIFKGEALDLLGLEVGMWARVVGERSGTGGVIADLVQTSYPIRRALGEITSVDEAGETLTILTRRGQEEVTFIVDGNTRFRSRDESVNSLADLEPGMYALVIGKNNPAVPENLAVLIAASHPEDMPRPDRRVLGEVVSIGSDSIIVEARDGQQYTFEITSETRIRSRGGQINGVEDLEVGMIILIAGNDQGDGTYMAVLIAVPRR